MFFLIPSADTQWNIPFVCLTRGMYWCPCVLYLLNSFEAISHIFSSLLFFKVQFRIVSMDANFIPVGRVVSSVYLLFAPTKIPTSELHNLVWFLPSRQWIWSARSILVQESGRWKEGCLLILKTAWVWSAVWSSVINMLSEFIWHTLHLTQTSESIRAQGLFRLCWESGKTQMCAANVKFIQMDHMMRILFSSVLDTLIENKAAVYTFLIFLLPTLWSCCFQHLIWEIFKTFLWLQRNIKCKNMTHVII